MSDIKLYQTIMTYVPILHLHHISIAVNFECVGITDLKYITNVWYALNGHKLYLQSSVFIHNIYDKAH